MKNEGEMNYCGMHLEVYIVCIHLFSFNTDFRYTKWTASFHCLAMLTEELSEFREIR